VEELTCGGMVSQVREAFAETMTSVVQVVARFPIACCNSIGLLCIVPYTRWENKPWLENIIVVSHNITLIVLLNNVEYVMLNVTKDLYMIFF